MTPRTSPLLEALAHGPPVVTVELRPPRSGLAQDQAMDAWIDMSQAVRRFTDQGRFVLLTDDAVGQPEEESLAHLEANLAEAASRRLLIPFLTCKHPLDYCLLFAERAWGLGFETLTVLGGDPSVGPPRCVPHAHQLRARIRERLPELALGGWANPYRDAAEQAGFLRAPGATVDFVLTQVVPEHAAHRLAALVDELDRSGPRLPVVAGVFHYRSANPRTLARLARFFPVPVEELTRAFQDGAEPEELTARSIRAALRAGARGVYVSNLEPRSGPRTLGRILARV